MQYAALILALATGALAAYANDTIVAYETITTTAITTYCPEPTTVVHGSLTFTVTEATTLTITDCPCTITKPIVHPTASTVFYTSCPPGASSKPAVETYPAAGPPASSGPVYTNPLTASYTSQPVGTGTSPPYATYTGAAAANKVGGFVVGAAALAVLAL